MSEQSEFFIGRIFDSKFGKITNEAVNYDPADLTTHAVITGMTGSGKTGLCITLLEEAALQGIPAIIIDPKGDLTNLLLHFPDLLPADFQPWLDPDSVRRSGKTMEAAAAETSTTWKKGLADWGLGREQLLALEKAVEFSVFTPGSTSGQQVDILSSFQAPEIPWAENAEILREKISSQVTALLGLVGINNVDPLKSREHILLSNIIETAWSKSAPLNLTDLILQTQKPPFERLGAFPVNSFYPEKERFELAMLLNNFLASPSFQTWLEGTPLDIGAMMFTPEGKPRHNIFYIAHLSDGERMFFVTLLFAAIESWMRAQRGTGSLRALVYFDEILGYLPPVANPSSRPVMLRMLKQARAFGLGLVLATQNPVDLDYKALSNAGTWLIGRLQTDQDKQRLLDGLESAGGGLERSVYDKLLSSLGKRVFLLQNVHNKAPVLIQSRWALNYLAGPLTRAQIPALMKLKGIRDDQNRPTGAAAAADKTVGGKASVGGTGASGKTGAGTSSRPAVPGGISEYFLMRNFNIRDSAAAAGVTLTGLKAEAIIYRPQLLAQAEVRYFSPKYGIEYTSHPMAMVANPPDQRPEWEEAAGGIVDKDAVESQPAPGVLFAELPAVLTDSRKMDGLQKDFLDWVYRSGTIRIKANEALKVYAAPDVSDQEFQQKCARAAQSGGGANKELAAMDKKISALMMKIQKQKMEVQRQQSELTGRRAETLFKGGEILLSLFGGAEKKRLDCH
ncbi:MAG: ATP-binding protein [Anaerolineaceae bacterium]